MNCERPYITKGGAYGCGQCPPCRVQRQRVWTHRIMLEAACHKENSFVTLTYDDDHIPINNSLNPGDLRNFIKRLRKRAANKIRYYAIGEYGDTTGRPHYHIALFNHQSCEHGITRERKGRPSCCPTCDRILSTWGLGKIQLGTLEQSSASYIGGYVSKKYTVAQATNGRHPQFTRMSLKPALGLNLMHDVASTLMQHNLERKLIDVPIALQHGSHQWPLGRYLRRKLRTYIGRPANAPQEVVALQEIELQTMRETAWANQASLKTTILDASLGKRRQIAQRTRRKSRETA